MGRVLSGKLLCRRDVVLLNDRSEAQNIRKFSVSVSFGMQDERYLYKDV